MKRGIRLVLTKKFEEACELSVVGIGGAIIPGLNPLPALPSRGVTVVGIVGTLGLFVLVGVEDVVVGNPPAVLKNYSANACYNLQMKENICVYTYL